MDTLVCNHKRQRAKLALEDGRIFPGFSFGATGTALGEVVFNTSLAGYQEILTDPSYKGQMVTMTYPLIGNYGVNEEDVESHKPFVEAFIVKECSRIASNWRSTMTLDEYLKKNNIIGIEGVDTRAITRHARLQGAMKAVLSTEDLDDKSLVAKAKASTGLVGVDLVKEVTSSEIKHWTKEGKYKVVVLDCGVKLNILRELAGLDCQVIVVPASTTAEEILALNPDGLMLSNGPGDPAAVTYVVETVKQLIGKLPMFGICLGHQMLGQALGGKTYKLKFGHHGGNQPVKDLKTGKIDISVQNHGFCVDIDSLNKDDIEITHINLNDQTLEGIRHKKLPIISVQFHPEACPGPHDSKYLFKQFMEMIENA
ncbi:MAG: glutamine-hydrolyzing carbamoyl-phosphate synthase small subunit [PVC group bacterium]|nr:glutamine-hydrolyzing carbamoyl-phosphate synthase small subunit [PVC group bacterium]